MWKGQDIVAFSNPEAEEYAAAAVYRGRIGTVARLAAEAAGEDAFLAAVPAVQVFGADFRDQLDGRRRHTVDGGPRYRRFRFDDDAEVVARYLRSSPGCEWDVLECVPRDRGETGRAIADEEDVVSGRLRYTLLTYGFGGHAEGFAALRRSMGRGALPWFAEDFDEARPEFTPEWWGRLLYPGGLAPGDTGTVEADVERFAASMVATV